MAAILANPNILTYFRSEKSDRKIITQLPNEKNRLLSASCILYAFRYQSFSQTRLLYFANTSLSTCTPAAECSGGCGRIVAGRCPHFYGQPKMGFDGHHIDVTSIYSGTHLLYTDEQLYTRIALSAAMDWLG
jgi:hypothetical protein